MDAPLQRNCALLLFIAVLVPLTPAAVHRTPNFTITASSEVIARQVGKAAETYRRDLATFWLGHPLPRWSRPCELRVRDGSIAASGETRFQFVGGEVINWKMYVNGSVERILDSVLPHEINHTIFACHFRRPLPRWADEGAATLFEHRSEQMKQLDLLNRVLDSGAGFIDLRRLLQMKEYPKEYRAMLIMYAEGFALVDFLVQQGGRSRYLKFLTDGEKIGWTEAIRSNYHHGGVESLEKNWRAWIRGGMPKLKSPREELLAGLEESPDGYMRPRILNEYAVNTTVRSQSPEPAVSVARDSAHDARPVPKKGSGAKGSVFVGLPSENRWLTETSGKGGATEDKETASRPRRAASFEAPAPRMQRTTSGRIQVPKTQSSSSRKVDAKRKAGFESTGSRQFDPNRRHSKELRERRLVSGSIPQWAGFPGQKELF